MSMKRKSAFEGVDDYENSVNVYESDHVAECSIGSRCDRCIYFGFVQPMNGGEPRRVCLECGEPAK